jgi:diguanylate cyclase (GGDEF)-like protein
VADRTTLSMMDATTTPPPADAAADGTLRAFSALDRAPGQFAVLLDPDYRIRWHSSSLPELTGWDDLTGRLGTDFVHADDLPLALDVMMLYTRDADRYASRGHHPVPESVAIRLLHADGAYSVYESQLYNLLGDPQIGGYLQVSRLVRDRSDLPRAIGLLGEGAPLSEVLPTIARYIRSGYESHDAVVVSWWDDGQLRHSTPFDDDRPWTREPSLVGAARLVSDLDLASAEAFTDLDDPRLDDLGLTARLHGFESLVLFPLDAVGTGERLGAVAIWSEMPNGSVVPPQSAAGTGLAMATLAITDAHAKQSLRWAASHDPLTGLINRAEFARRLDRLASDDVALLYVDLDDFKPVNDQWGHPVGDAVLVEVGRRIADELGPLDTVGRLGGDEFAVMCPEVDDIDAGLEVAARVMSSIRQPVRIGELTIRIGCSVGVALGKQPLIPSVLVQRADEALLQAKQRGKNLVVVAP